MSGCKISLLFSAFALILVPFFSIEAQTPKESFEGYFFLEGLIDSNGTTHLFYRMQEDQSEQKGGIYRSHSLYHLHIDNSIDSLFFESYVYNFNQATDDSTAGHLWATDNTLILESTDYGPSFETWKTLGDTITGLYFDSYHRDLYLSTPNNILRFETRAPAISADTLKDTTFTSVQDQPDRQLPQQTELLPNYSNPFNPTTKVTYRLQQATPVRLILYNSVVEQLQNLVNKQ